MKKINEKVAKSIYALNQNQDFIVLKEHLKESLQEEYSTSDDILDTEEMLRSQGRRQELRAILREIDDAQSVLERFDKNRK